MIIECVSRVRFWREVFRALNMLACMLPHSWRLVVPASLWKISYVLCPGKPSEEIGCYRMSHWSILKMYYIPDISRFPLKASQNNQQYRFSRRNKISDKKARTQEVDIDFLCKVPNDTLKLSKGSELSKKLVSTKVVSVLVIF